MPMDLTRRRMLQMMALGGLGGALAACTSRSPAPQAPAAAPTDAPAAPTSAPVAPTAAPAAPTAAPAPTASAAAPTPAPAAAPTAIPAPTIAPVSLLGQQIGTAAVKWLDSLEGERRARATYAFTDPERVRWHWTTPAGFPRNGLALRDMDQPQRDLAMALLAASVSPAGLQKAIAIMELQRELGNDPDLYFVTVFGNPGGAEPWSWRWEGHHYSRHFTVVGETVTSTPFFLGAWPTTTDAGARAMAREQDAANELVNALTGAARDQAIFDTNTLTRHITQNEPYVSPLEPVGVPYSALAQPQQALVDEIIATYLSTLAEPVAAPILARIDAAGRGDIRFGWAGPLEAGRPHYYRLQGPVFLLEFDNSRNRGTHIHSVWRDFSDDFGRNLGV